MSEVKIMKEVGGWWSEARLGIGGHNPVSQKSTVTILTPPRRFVQVTNAIFFSK
jgi:hypothetical protein